MPVELETVVDTTGDTVGIKCSVAKDLKEQIHAAGVQATKEIFEEQILPEARSLSPVLTGKNRDSISVSFRDRLETGWISAWLFTQSGYGWLLEHGTSHNRALTKTPKRRRTQVAKDDRTAARPYIYPAMRLCSLIAERAREILESL
jgi:hypothetical protein